MIARSEIDPSFTFSQVCIGTRSILAAFDGTCILYDMDLKVIKTEQLRMYTFKIVTHVDARGEDVYFIVSTASLSVIDAVHDGIDILLEDLDNANVIVDIVVNDNMIVVLQKEFVTTFHWITKKHRNYAMVNLAPLPAIYNIGRMTIYKEKSDFETFVQLYNFKGNRIYKTTLVIPDTILTNPSKTVFFRSEISITDGPVPLKSRSPHVSVFREMMYALNADMEFTAIGMFSHDVYKTDAFKFFYSNIRAIHKCKVFDDQKHVFVHDNSGELRIFDLEFNNNAPGIKPHLARFFASSFDSSGNIFVVVHDTSIQLYNIAYKRREIMKKCKEMLF